MEQTIKIIITQEHLKKSHGYIFDDCPLKLAIQELYPNSFVSVGGPKIIIIHDKKHDKIGLMYKPSSNYSPAIDSAIGLIKEKGEEFYMEVILTLVGTEYNYFQHEPIQDYVVEEVPQLPPDLFAD